MKDVINKDKVLAYLVELSLCQNEEEAMKWYKNSRLESCAYKTSEELINDGMGDLVIDYIKRTSDGGYA